MPLAAPVISALGCILLNDAEVVLIVQWTIR
jgi:hypothetical protein